MSIRDYFFARNKQQGSRRTLLCCHLSVNEDGSLMLMALVLMLLGTIWGMAAIELASMEKKVSYYLVQSQQAQEAADAGAEWAIEEIWHRGLPADFAAELLIAEGITAQIEVLEKGEEFDCLPFAAEGSGEKAEDESPENVKKQCCYCFTSSGVYKKAKKKIKVKVLYSYYADSPQSYESAVIEYYRQEMVI